MEEARAVLARLERIEELERQDVPAGVLLEEVRALLTEAEAWVRAEPAGTDAAVDSIDRCRAVLAHPVEAIPLRGKCAAEANRTFRG